jgi:hypothetical protein
MIIKNHDWDLFCYVEMALNLGELDDLTCLHVVFAVCV